MGLDGVTEPQTKTVKINTHTHTTLNHRKLQYDEFCFVLQQKINENKTQQKFTGRQRVKKELNFYFYFIELLMQFYFVRI